MHFFLEFFFFKGGGGGLCVIDEHITLGCL